MYKLVFLMFLFGMNLVLFAQKNKIELKSNFFLTDPVSGKQVSQNFDVVNTSSSFDNYIVCVGCKKVNDNQYAPPAEAVPEL